MAKYIRRLQSALCLFEEFGGVNGISTASGRVINNIHNYSFNCLQRKCGEEEVEWHDGVSNSNMNSLPMSFITLLNYTYSKALFALSFCSFFQLSPS